MSRLLRPSIALVPIALASVAPAAGYRWAPASGSWTEPAGASALRYADLMAARDYFGLQALKAWDFDRRACQMQLEAASFNAPGLVALEPSKVCEPKLSQSWKRADLGNGVFATGVSVCTASSPDSVRPIRGIELRGVSIGPSGKLVPAKKPVRIEFPGCQKWSKPVACPAENVATGLRGFTEGDQGVVGLALRCHALAAIE